MAQVVNETDKLTYILTEYGLGRVAEALADTTVNIYLTKIKVGNADYEYYEPQESATNLKGPIDGEFPIIEKDLLEDGLTISLHAVFPESLNNCEIREVGIYETVNGEDHLFALSTQQPLLKPSLALNYFSTVDYFAFLKSQNLADIYDQILLNPDDQLVTQEDLGNLMRTIAFTEGNLMEQINGNSRVIGLNRAEQLRQKVEKNREEFGYITTYNIYSLLLNEVKAENIFGYWVFNYPRRTASTSSVTDVSINRRNLSSNKPINTYNRVYNGITPMLEFNSPNYYFLNQEASPVGFDPTIFTIVGNPDVDSVGIASDFSGINYITTEEINVAEGDTNALYFDFKILENGESQSIMHTANNYTFNAHFDSSNSELVAQLGDGFAWRATLTCPIELNQDYRARIVWNDTNTSLGILVDGSYQEVASSALSSRTASDFGTLVIGSPNGIYGALKGTEDLKELSFRVNGAQIFSGSKQSTSNSMSFVSNDSTDIPFSMIFAVEPLGTGDRTLIARSNYATNTNIFEVTEKEDRSLQIRLFADANNFMTFKSSPNTLPTTAHSIAFSYDAMSRSIKAFTGGRKLSLNKTSRGTYVHMNDTVPTLYAFTYTQNGTIWTDSSTTPTKLLNADGSPYIGTNWAISDNRVFFDEFVATYNQAKDETTDLLYAWNYNDGLDDMTIYTKELTITADTVLYNADYTPYTGSAFFIVLSGTGYIIQYNSNTTEYTENMNILPKTLYAFYYEGNLKTVWTNSSSVPSVLYDSNGDLYTGTEFTLSNNTIYYIDGGIASYNSLFNILIPALPVTSYVTGADGKPEKHINSNIGVVAVIKEKIEDENLRALSLNLEAALGNNPCITI